MTPTPVSVIGRPSGWRGRLCVIVYRWATVAGDSGQNERQLPPWRHHAPARKQISASRCRGLHEELGEVALDFAEGVARVAGGLHAAH